MFAFFLFQLTQGKDVEPQRDVPQSSRPSTVMRASDDQCGNGSELTENKFTVVSISQIIF